MLIFGGACNDYASTLIAKYTNDQWEHVGNLQNSRAWHRAIVNDDRVYVVGGSGTQYVSLHKILTKVVFFSKTEIWSVDENDDTVSMKIGNTTLTNYYWYPELFIVDSDFCTKK